MKPLLHELVLKRRLVCDGAMGTQLMLAGLEPGGCGEEWNLSHPDRILKIHREYVEAGADCIITNTFGGSSTMLSRHGLGDKVREINAASVQIARESFDGLEGYVLGDIGPLGAILEPYGDLPQDVARESYEEQARALVEAGADAIIIETQTSLEEVGIAIDACRACGSKSIIASMAYDLSADKAFYVTMMGVLPEVAASFLEERGANIVSLNCGTGVDMRAAADVVRSYRAHTSLPLMVQPNAGLPVLEKGKAVYKQSPEEMASGVSGVLEAGAGIVGSCCGSTPDHTKHISRIVHAMSEATPSL